MKFIKIKNEKPGGEGFFVLAERDFDPAVHMLWEPKAEKPAPVKAAAGDEKPDTGKGDDQTDNGGKAPATTDPPKTPKAPKTSKAKGKGGE
ncbi:MAG: hypothetical protein AB7O67_16580 [Vicinamibacterales bacterium]